ncbi:LpqB family beta-propeller domain-containing protein [Micromonospora deserti]|uniref:GerMN domain-containing protein n=1 Tax=Micromonospora deserti TaxID=2070366 RepID=A0A2W2CGS9_9ACTN|nr:LpqB family beta-propeller domain-containing protein [Micromonospora deserti]PZF97060.1 hypothetical protein C1I99_16360 [Micromonospora deserti]
MTRALLAGVVGVVLLVTGLAGCGIPGSTGVEVERRVSSAEAGTSSGRSQEPPTRAASGSDAEEFVRNFLAAAAGEPDRAYYRVKQFIAPEDRSELQEKQGSEVALTVVRLTEAPVITPDVESTKVTIAVQQIGVLRTNGTLAPPVATETKYQFGLRSAATGGQGNVEDAGLFVTAPPNVLLLSHVALQEYYEPASVYFWSSDRNRLVPDQRYLPLTVPDERQVTEVVRWLINGPSDWLRPAVSGLPDRTEMINNATGGDGRWEVNLTMPGDDERRLDQFATQLAWSLPELDGELELKVQNQSRTVVNLREQRLKHPLYPLIGNPQRYCVYDGAVHPLAFAGEPGGTVPVAPEANRNVVSAGFSRAAGGVLAALVVAGADGRQRLTVGTGTDPVTAFRSSSWYAAIGRPVWLRSADTGRPYGLVVADRRLHRFGDDATLTPVTLNVTGQVTAVAAALDGTRIAMIVGGALYVAAVTVDGGGVTLGPARRLATSLTGLSAVDWAGEDSLVLAGSADRPGIHQVSVDGAREFEVRGDVGAKVTHLSAFPVNPVVQQPSGAVMYEANGVAYRSPAERIKREQVLEVTPPPAGVRPGNPTAPFFLY